MLDHCYNTQLSVASAMETKKGIDIKVWYVNLAVVLEHHPNSSGKLELNCFNFLGKFQMLHRTATSVSLVGRLVKFFAMLTNICEYQY